MTVVRPGGALLTVTAMVRAATLKLPPRLAECLAALSLMCAAPQVDGDA